MYAISARDVSRSPRVPPLSGTPLADVHDHRVMDQLHSACVCIAWRSPRLRSRRVSRIRFSLTGALATAEPPRRAVRPAYGVPSRLSGGATGALGQSFRIAFVPHAWSSCGFAREKPHYRMDGIVHILSTSRNVCCRLAQKSSPNAMVPPHTHPDIKNIAVISGSLGWAGERDRQAKGQGLPAASPPSPESQSDAVSHQACPLAHWQTRTVGVWGHLPQLIVSRGRHYHQDS